MLFLFLVYSVVLRPHFASFAAPIAIGRHALQSREESIEGVVLHKNYRSTADIVWACWLTIFACTWVTVHPNVRGYQSTRRQRVMQRIELMFWAIMAPEVMVMWAFRQWRGARGIRSKVWEKMRYDERRTSGGSWIWFWMPEKRDREYGVPTRKWTFTHSHFLQMGGYMFEKDGIIQCIDTCGESTDLEKEALEAVILRPETEEEINDRSKGDALAKTFVVLQTLWFIIQCAARGFQNLAITEIEVTTLAYAALNGIMYFFWWNKPLGVQCPIIIKLNSPHAEFQSRSPTSDIGIAEGINGEGDTARPGVPFMGFEKALLGKFIRKLYKPFRNWILPVKAVILLLLTVISLPEHFIRRLYKIMDQDTLPPPPSGPPAPQSPIHFPTYYAYGLDDSFIANFIPGIIGAFLASIFGAIHCIAWPFPFPSVLNQLLWRISSIYICLSPLSLIVVGSLEYLRDASPSGSVRWSVLDCVGEYLMYLCVASFVLYIPARLILLILSFIELNHLQATAHQLVEWTSFLPHV